MFTKLYRGFATSFLNNLRLGDKARQASQVTIRTMSAFNELPQRCEQLEILEKCDYDVLIIGGGATGAGCALDAVTRGLKTALVEADDFASGASSKSAKLLHGNMCELTDALRKFKFHQYTLSSRALKERSVLLNIAPHLTQPVQIMIPLYNWWETPFYWLSAKLYDLAAGMSLNVCKSKYVGKDKVLCEFPLLYEDCLRGAIVYSDAIMDDARLCLSLALTAAQHGANICNHCEVIELGNIENKCRCVRVSDKLTNKEFSIRTKCVINATGAQTDAMRLADNPKTECISKPSCGAHLILPKHFGSSRYGLCNPRTHTGGSMFLLPWKGHIMAGATYTPCESDSKPNVCEEDAVRILCNLRDMLEEHVGLTFRHIRSAWSGIRTSIIDLSVAPSPESEPEPEPESDCDEPYKLDDDDQDDEAREICETYLIEIGCGNMITIAGGNWTLYRAMAEEAINSAVDNCNLDCVDECLTHEIPIEGACDYSYTLTVDLAQAHDLPFDVAEHLAQSYGTNARALLKESTSTTRQRLHPEFPFIGAEVEYACSHEYAYTLVDVIARRLRIAFLDVNATLEMLPTIITLMTQKMEWSEDDQKKQIQLAYEFLCQNMGLGSIIKPVLKSKAQKAKSDECIDEKDKEKEEKEMSCGKRAKEDNTDKGTAVCLQCKT